MVKHKQAQRESSLALASSIDEKKKSTHFQDAIQFYIHELYKDMDTDEFAREDRFEMFPL